MIITKVIEDFIRYEKAIGSTPATIKHYQLQLNAFLAFYGKTDIEYIKYETYERYILYLKNKGKKGTVVPLSGRTIKTYASALRTFLAWAYKNKYIDEDIAIRIKMPKYKKKIIKILSNNDIEKFVKNFDLEDFIGCRDLLIFCLMLESGLRLSEVILLSAEDIDLVNYLIKVNGKGQKERYVPISAYLEKVLRFYFFRYYEYFGKDLVPEDPLICLRDGSPATKNTVSLIFRRLRKKTGIHVYPHLLRHTFATMFLLNGGTIDNLQIILGHSTLNMVLNYLHFANEMKLSKQSIYSPLSNMGK